VTDGSTSVETALDIRDLRKSFRGADAVAGVTMTIPRGEVFGLVGPDGAGKSTLIRMLATVLAPTSGDALVFGRSVVSEAGAVKPRIGYMSQAFSLYGDLTVRENLAFSVQAYGASAPPLPPALAAYADVLVRALPLGPQRRLAFVAALAHHPAVLVLDEPTSGVDALARAELWDTIREQSEHGVGVLVTTHYMQEAEQCDRLLLMSRAQLVAQGSERDIVGSTTAVAVRTDDWAGAFAALNAAGEPVMLSGRAIRVADSDPERLRVLLDDAGIAATYEPVTATIEERMMVLARAAGTSES
jgi:ABC-2 type transport system ATP-binding protein/ribosome-dependent ATPase